MQHERRLPPPPPSPPDARADASLPPPAPPARAQMLFTWDTTNLCIVFRQWHVRSTAALIFSLAAVVALAMGYEALRAVSRLYEASLARRIAALPRKPACPSPSVTPPPRAPPFLLCRLPASPPSHGIVRQC